MAYKLLVLDIDGTVTNSDKKVLKETREAVVHLQEKGIHVAIASGRAPQGIYSVAEELELDRFGNYILAFKYTIAASERCGNLRAVHTATFRGRQGRVLRPDRAILSGQF